MIRWHFRLQCQLLLCTCKGPKFSQVWGLHWKKSFQFMHYIILFLNYARKLRWWWEIVNVLIFTSSPRGFRIQQTKWSAHQRNKISKISEFLQVESLRR